MIATIFVITIQAQENCKSANCLLKSTQTIRRHRRDEPKKAKSRLTFSNLRDFITQLRASSTLSRESLNNIKSNIENLKVFNQDDVVATTLRPFQSPVGTEGLLPASVTRRPPFMYQTGRIKHFTYVV